MAEITSSPTVSIQSLLYPANTEIQATSPTTQTNPLDTTPLVSPDTSMLTSSGRGYSAATLGLTPPRPGGAAESDLLAIRQLLDDMNSDMRDNEIMASAQRKATAMGSALSLLGGMVSNMSEALSLTVELPKAIEDAGEKKTDYEDKKAITQGVAGELAPVTAEFNKLTGDIRQGNLDISGLEQQIRNKDAGIKDTSDRLIVANADLKKVSDDWSAKNQELVTLQLQWEAATDPALKLQLQGKITTAQLERQQLEGLQTTRQKTVSDLSAELTQLQKDRDTLADSHKAKVDQVAGWQSRLETIKPTKTRLEGELATARETENTAYGAWRTAQNHADAIPGRIADAFSNFSLLMTGFTLMANRLVTVPGMPDAGVETELLALKKDNAEALQELWKIMSDSREKLGADALINAAINSKLSDVDDVQRNKIGLAFSSIFTSLQQALTSMATLLDPAASTGGSNFSESQPQRMRFAIGGSA